VNAADPFVVGFPPLDHEAAGSGERLKHGFAFEWSPVSVHALNKLTSVLNFEGDASDVAVRYAPRIVCLIVPFGIWARAFSSHTLSREAGKAFGHGR
jgi:hypothetical protein